MTDRADFENDVLHEDRDPEEIAEEHDQLVEFGRAIRQLRNAAYELEYNGHWTVGAHEAAEDALENLDIVAREHFEVMERRQEEMKNAD